MSDKIFKCLSAGILTVVLLSICQSVLAEKPQYSAPKATIVMGGDQNFPPSTFIENDRPVGFQVDLLRAVAAASNLEVEINFSPWKETLEKLRTGEVDVVAMSYSKQRDEDFDFSVQFALNAFGLMVREESDIRTISDVKGKKILVQQGGVMRDYIESNRLDADITFVKDIETIIRSLSEGSHDGAFLSQKTALYVAKKLGIPGLRFTDEVISPRRTAYGVAEGNYELVQLLNEGVAVINANGQLQAINEKWFGTATEKLVDIELVKKWAFRGVGIALLVIAIFTMWTRSLKTQIVERQQAEDALNSERQLLEDILEGTNAGTWDWNVQTGEVVLNEVWANFMGRTLKELQPIDINTWINHVHPDDFPMANELLEKHFGGELPYFDVEFRQPHKNGGWVWVNARGKVVDRAADGTPLQMRGTHLDITERKVVEEEREKLITDLQLSLDEIKSLKAIVPMCSYCKKIRDDKGYWDSVESYISTHTGAEMSHGVCPDCLPKAYSEAGLEPPDSKK